MKAAQTPARSRVSRTPLDVMSLGAPSASNIGMMDGLDVYEEIWSEAGVAAALTMPPVFRVKDLLVETLETLERVKTAVEVVNETVNSDRNCADANALSAHQRATDLELSLGDPSPDWSYGSTVWSSLGGLANAVETVSANASAALSAVPKIETEFSSMFAAVTSFQASVSSKLSTIGNRVDTLESSSLAAMGPADIEKLMSSVELMSSRLSDLERQKARDRAEIDSLHTRLESGSVRLFEFSPDVVFRGPRDVRCYLVSIGADALSFGGFADVYNLLARANMMIESNPTFAEAVKSQKDVSGTNMSQDEALVKYSFLSNVPGIFSRKKTDKTSIPSLPTSTKWKCEKIINSGMGYELEEHIDNARTKVEEVVSLLYSEHDRLQSLCLSIVARAADFIMQFVRWVDETNSSLISAGNAPADVWALMTKVMCAIFEEGLAPHRVTPTSSKFRDPLEQTSVMIWGVIRTHLATCALTKKGFKDHPVVVGAYAQWLVSNSGKRDASEAKASIAKLTSAVADLKDTVAIGIVC